MTTKLFIATLLASMLLAWPAQAQEGVEVLRLKSGRLIQGRVTEILDDAFVLTRSLGGGTVIEKVRFSRLEPSSLYATLSVLLSPHDREDHLRLAESAFGGKLFATATRHYRKATEGIAPTTEILGKIDACIDHDIDNLLSRSRTALDGEQFSRARRLAELAMRRHPRHERIGEIPAYLATITRRREAAKRREAALARTRHEKRRWDAGERIIAGVSEIVDRAARAETRALAGGSRFRTTKTRIEDGLKHLRSAEKKARPLRQSRDIPEGLKPKVRELENRIIDLNIRLRLHVASLHTVRGSYSSALAYVNAALSYDPSDEQALAARARIEQAAASSSRGFRFVR